MAPFPDFSDPAPVLRIDRLIDPASLPAPTFVFVIRDRRTGAEYLDETKIGRDFRLAVRDLVNGQIPSAFDLARVLCLDELSGRLLDVTPRALNEAARIYEAGNDPGGVPACLRAAFADYGVALPEIGEFSGEAA